MNKKEIAQQYTRRMLEQSPTEQNEQPQEKIVSEPKANEPPKQTEYEQMQGMLKMVQLMYQKAQDNYKSSLNKEAERSFIKLREVDTTATSLAFQIQRIVTSAEEISKAQNKVGSRWVIRLYVIAILSAICSALTTLVVVWLLWN